MYDIIGDIHGCYDELLALLTKLGYGQMMADPICHPDDRQVIFVGDLADRGPNSPGVLKTAMEMVNTKNALAVLGNHDDKLRRWLKGNKIKINNGLDTTIKQLEENKKLPKSCSRRVDLRKLEKFLELIPTQLLLDDNKLSISHAGLKEQYHGVQNKKTRSKALYGEVTGERDDDGYPIRRDWASKYSGDRTVVHGHVAGEEVRVKNNVYNVDTSCVYGGKLTALRYPEMEIVSVPAKHKYWGK